MTARDIWGRTTDGRRIDYRTGGCHTDEDCKEPVAAELKTLDQMRLQIVQFPDATNTGFGQPLRLGQIPRIPVGGVHRRLR